MRLLLRSLRQPQLGAFLFIAWLLGLGACEPVLVEPAYYGTLTVTVLDGSTSQPLANVSISTTPATGSFVTDAKGQVVISQVPAGTVSIAARRAAYDAATGTATLTEGQTQSVVLLLNKAASTAAPAAAGRPTPAVGAMGLPTTVQLAWRAAAGASPGDSLRYEVVLFESNNLNQRTLLTNSRDSTVAASGLLYNTTYYWQVTTRNAAKASTRGPIWSFQTAALPDNRYLYARTVAGNTDIYSSDAQGASVLRLTSAATVETNPQLSPNRDLIAYASNASGQYQLYTMNRDGSGQRRITTLSAEGYNNAGVGYRWSPDGGQLLYAHYDQLYRINRDGTGLVLLATAPAGRHFRECDWTMQSGGRLLVQTMGVSPTDSEIYLYNVDGSNPVQVVGNLPGRVDSPSFSIDGASFVYTHDVAGFASATGRQLDAHLFIQAVNGSSLVDITSGATGTSGKAAGTNDLTPRYSPTGFQLIFVNRDNDDIAPPEVWTCDLSGRNRTRLFTNAFMPDYK
ncbi:carboxypeptidase regulatory-like domain-containing protein [Hymenobacter bucti]|uniref:Carboxypeptidase regulatory-like domain-containing protein n=1 Tax=Hymenobacter bucti TaxID=1844114 RepID=A0ABW4QQB0_9BACT